MTGCRGRPSRTNQQQLVYQPIVPEKARLALGRVLWVAAVLEGLSHAAAIGDVDVVLFVLLEAFLRPWPDTSFQASRASSLW